MSPTLVLSASNCAKVLYRLAEQNEPDARAVFWRIASSWRSPERTHITFDPREDEQAVLDRITMPQGVVPSHRYLATYQCKRKPEIVVRIRTDRKPVKHRTLRTAGGKARFVLTSVVLLKETDMAKAKSKQPIDELEDELAGLEELEDELDELEEIDDEDEDESEDEDDSYESMTIAELKALAKERGVTGIAKANKTKLIALLEAADEAGDDEDEDEEDEDDSPLEGLTRAELKAYNTEHGLGVSVKKSMSDDDLRAALEAAMSDDEDEDDDEEEDDEPVAKKPATKGKAKAKTGGATRTLPAGKLGANDIAERSGRTALSVRNFLRSEAGAAFPKNEELGRYAFTEKQVAAIISKMGPAGKRGPKPKAAATVKASAKKGKAKK